MLVGKFTSKRQKTKAFWVKNRDAILKRNGAT